MRELEMRLVAPPAISANIDRRPHHAGFTAGCYRNSVTPINHRKLMQSPTVTLEHPNIEILLELTHVGG